MAKFVDWANSLLNRFEEQVKVEFDHENRPISSHPNWKISSFSYFLSSLCVWLSSSVRPRNAHAPSSVAISNWTHQFTGANQHRTEHRAEFNSNQQVSILAGDCGLDENAAACQWDCKLIKIWEKSVSTFSARLLIFLHSINLRNFVTTRNDSATIVWLSSYRHYPTFCFSIRKILRAMKRRWMWSFCCVKFVNSWVSWMLW